MSEPHLTSGTSEYFEGYEHYTFRVSIHGYNVLAKARDPLQILSGWYTSIPRPHPTEIVGILDTKLDQTRRLVIITLKIQRGHYILANALRDLASKHGLDPDSIPDFKNAKPKMQEV